MQILSELYVAVRNLDDLSIVCTEQCHLQQIISERNKLFYQAEELQKLTLMDEAIEIYDAITAINQLAEAAFEAKEEIDKGGGISKTIEAINKAAIANSKVSALLARDIICCNTHGSSKGE